MYFSLHFCYKLQSLTNRVFLPFPNISLGLITVLVNTLYINSMWNFGKFPFPSFFLKNTFFHFYPPSLSEVFFTWQESCNVSKCLFPPENISIIFVSIWPNFNYDSPGHEATHIQLSVLCSYSLSQNFKSTNSEQPH